MRTSVIAAERPAGPRGSHVQEDSMSSNDSLTDQIRNWFERTPKAQRAYQRLSADLDTVVERIDTATHGLREKIGPVIDPPRVAPKANPAPQVSPDSASRTAENA